MRRARPYADPYVSGVALGIVLLLAFVLMGRGLGASGGFASVAAGAVDTVAPNAAAGSTLLSRYLAESASPWLDWLVIELVGVMLGGAISAWFSGRLRRGIERGPRVTPRLRLAAAFGGGAIMGIGAVFARGCTSGQALTGGALLSVGSWLFIAGAFAAAYAAAPLMRRAWL